MNVRTRVRAGRRTFAVGPFSGSNRKDKSCPHGSAIAHDPTTHDTIPFHLRSSSILIKCGVLKLSFHPSAIAPTASFPTPSLGFAPSFVCLLPWAVLPFLPSSLGFAPSFVCLLPWAVLPFLSPFLGHLRCAQRSPHLDSTIPRLSLACPIRPRDREETP